ncbi:MAG: 2-C-methyl-D-erythritol 4-phosphate cytidylyltransferase [Lachnospiraceae bacterium]|nr:2-C-methyl-D-erythritol 4-phosphate cytidylyltransferase [Lachnospiraceae bacterium]
MNIALLLSGGKGLRIGGEVPKQYIDVKGVPIISYSLRTLIKHPLIDAVWIVAEEEYKELIENSIEKIVSDERLSENGTSFKNEALSEDKDTVSVKFRGFSTPGKNRQESILNGLRDIRKYAEDADKILVHDAARPFISDELITECFRAIEEHDGVLPVLPMKDTVYICNKENKITSLIDRSTVFRGQAPELFVFGKYYEANLNLGDDIEKINGSTEPAILEGMDIVTIEGDEENFKITTSEDLARMNNIMEKYIAEERM